MNEAIVVLILGTATPGGGFPLYGAAFAEMLNAQEPKIRIEPRNTKGSTENVPLLESGKLDLALVAGEIASAALAQPGTPLRSYVLANRNLPEETAYRVARAVHWAEGPLAARLEQARETTMANTLAAAPRAELLHPGVRRYLREAKLER